MIDRAMLHQLIDRLPEESLENIQRAVQYEGLAPSTVGRIPEATAEKIRRTFEQQRNAPDDWETLHKRMAQGEQRRVRHLRELRGGIEVAEMQPNGSYSSVQGFDKDGALIVLIFRYFNGHKLEIAERVSFSPDTHSLLYRQDITGPDGKHSHHEAHFSASAP